MQCIWFLTEDAESYSRQKKFGLALKRYHSIWKVVHIGVELFSSCTNGPRYLRTGQRINLISTPSLCEKAKSELILR